MTYDETLEKMVAEGAIRVFRLSDSTAYVYRLKDNQYEVRTLSAVNGDWQLTKTVVSRTMGRSADGWYAVLGLPRQAQPIELESAHQNPGYTKLSLRQCYTCKQTKPEAEFARPRTGDHLSRDWECNDCFGRRAREMAGYRKAGEKRSGDYLEKDTIASPPPPKGQI